MKKCLICDVLSKAREFERYNINKQKKSAWVIYLRLWLIFPISVCFALTCCYSCDFLQLVSTILSIFIGLFLTILVFVVDKRFLSPNEKYVGYFNLGITNSQVTQEYDLAINETKHLNAKDNVWMKASKYYITQLSSFIGKNVLISVILLLLICTYVLAYNFFDITFSDYVFTKVITIESITLFAKLLFIAGFKVMILFLIGDVFYNSLRIVGSVINFPSVKIERE